MILILGSANGYIGSAFQTVAMSRGITSMPIPRQSYMSFSAMMKELWLWKPQLVVNCAAYVDARGVDYNEDDRRTTYEVNALLPSMLAHACESMGIPLMHFSTGCIFQGDNGGKGWKEEEQPDSSMFPGSYVMSKLMAEREVRKYAKHYICRIRLPFDNMDHPRNLLTKLQRFEMVVEETQSITHRWDAVNAALDIWQEGLPFDTYHLTSPGGINYKDICAEIAELIPNGRKSFKFIGPDAFDELLARTPKSRCVLSTEKLARLGVKVRPVEEAVLDSLKTWRTQ